MGNDALQDLLIAAGEAPPESRITLRDPIAAHGAAAIAGLMEPAWIGDPMYASFAIRVIARAGELGARAEAVDALRDAQSIVVTDHHRADIAAALAVLGAAPKGSRDRGPSRTVAAPMAVDDLVVDQCYKRRELHVSGLGGNWQRGISYPADGTYCLLFSDPAKVSEHGYRDAPTGTDGYRYFGEWDGRGDMTMAGGNVAVLDRSPELYLFTRAPCGHVYRGKYECVGWDWERTQRDGKERRAIVFTLRRSG